MQWSSSVPSPSRIALSLLEQVGELLDVEAVDLADLLLLRRVVAVVREVVVAVGDAR